MTAPGLIVAAPASGSGKTLLTLGLARLLARQGRAVAPAKAGPDYIDPAYLAAAAGRPCVNLDSWMQRPPTLAGAVAALGAGADLVLCEGVMGLFDGANIPDPGADGSTAALAAATGWPVVLVVDARGMGASVAALVRGFAAHRPGVRVAGVICNRVGGPGHREILRRALAELEGVALLGLVPEAPGLRLPHRHLGLVQAAERADLEAVLDAAAEHLREHCDIETIMALAVPAALAAAEAPVPLPPPGQRIAVARDEAFAFAYPLVLEGWRRAGADLTFFSPLADEAPDPSADAVYLPGGYPELHAARLAAAGGFLAGLRRAAGRGAAVIGECGGYMVLGRWLQDRDGARHAMAGLLPVATSFAKPRLHLGYRRAVAAAALPLGPAGAGFRGHEFHYASEAWRDPGAPAAFAVADAAGRALGPAGAVAGRVCGSFLHLADRAGG